MNKENLKKIAELLRRESGEHYFKFALAPQFYVNPDHDELDDLFEDAPNPTDESNRMKYWCTNAERFVGMVKANPTATVTLSVPAMIQTAYARGHDRKIMASKFACDWLELPNLFEHTNTQEILAKSGAFHRVTMDAQTLMFFSPGFYGRDTAGEVTREDVADVFQYIVACEMDEDELFYQYALEFGLDFDVTGKTSFVEYIENEVDSLWE